VTDLNLRVLEDGFTRLLENGDQRLLEADPVRRRTNFVTGWYFDIEGPFEDVVEFAEGRGEPFYV
jgi:hypothetical protein